jgi:hypothetical protein
MTGEEGTKLGRRFAYYHTYLNEVSAFPVEYVIRKFQEELELNGAHQLLFCADDVNIMHEDIE